MCVGTPQSLLAVDGESSYVLDEVDLRIVRRHELFTRGEEIVTRHEDEEDVEVTKRQRIS